MLWLIVNARMAVVMEGDHMDGVVKHDLTERTLCLAEVSVCKSNPYCRNSTRALAPWFVTIKKNEQ